MEKKSKVIVKRGSQVIETALFEDSDEAMAYRYELVMRQNYGETQLKDCSFTVVLADY